MKVYELTLRVDEQSLATIIDVTKDSASIIGIRPLADVEASKLRKKPHYVGGSRFKGIMAIDLIKKSLADGNAHTFDELTYIFKTHNFAEQSVSSTLSKAAKDGVVERLPNRQFKLKKA
jgi:hypothetical protein